MAAKKPARKRAPAKSAKKPAAKVNPVLAELQRQNEELRALLEQQSAAGTALRSRLSAINDNAQNPYSELMVGIRNVSDNTVGIPAMLGNPPIQLAAPMGDDDTGASAPISYAQWRELRKGKLVRDGAIMRDDTVVGAGLSVAPADLAKDLPPTHKHNAIRDPKAWIDERSEDEIREELDRITSEESLQRIRRTVDDELRRIEATRPVSDALPHKERLKAQASRARWAISSLPAKYRLVDDLITSRLEAPEAGEDWDGPIWAGDGRITKEK